MQHHSLVCRLHESSQTKNRCDYYHWMKDSTIIICVPAYDYADAKKNRFLARRSIISSLPNIWTTDAHFRTLVHT